MSTSTLYMISTLYFCLVSMVRMVPALCRFDSPNSIWIYLAIEGFTESLAKELPLEWNIKASPLHRLPY